MRDRNFELDDETFGDLRRIGYISAGLLFAALFVPFVLFLGSPNILAIVTMGAIGAFYGSISYGVRATRRLAMLDALEAREDGEVEVG